MTIRRVANDREWAKQETPTGAQALDERGAQRRRRLVRAGWGGATSLLAQVTSIFVATISIPLTANYLGVERYGLWVTMSSALAWLWLGELGFGAALTNTIAEADGHDDRDRASRVIATAFWVQSAVAAALLLVWTAVVLVVPLEQWLQVEGVISRAELRGSLLLALVLALGSLPLGLVVAVYRGRQEAYRANAWSIGGALLSLLALIGAVRMQAGLAGLVLAVFGTATATRAANFLWLFLVHCPWLRPWRRGPDRASLRRLWGLGAYYIGQQFGQLGTTQVQPVILTVLVGPGAAAQFSIAQRVFFLPQQLMLACLMPLVGAYGEAWARRDREWVRSTARWTTAATGCLGIASATLLYATYEPVVTTFVEAGLLLGRTGLGWMAVYAAVSSVLPSVAVALQGLARVRPLARAAIAQAMLVGTGGAALAWAWSTAGMAAAMAISVSITTLVPLTISLRRTLRGPETALVSPPGDVAR